MEFNVLKCLEDNLKYRAEKESENNLKLFELEQQLDILCSAGHRFTYYVRNGTIYLWGVTITPASLEGHYTLKSGERYVDHDLESLLKALINIYT